VQIISRFIKFGTSTDEVNSRVIPAHFTPTNYTPTQVGTEGNDKTSAHLKGIDNALASAGGISGDISHTSFSLANNQAAAANVTGLAFANAVTRSAEVHYSIVVDATSDLYEAGTLHLIQKGASWELAQTTVGDNSQVTFSVTNAGQVQYTTPSYAGFVSGTMKFRAITTLV
jgi:hypothetical protein